MTGGGASPVAFVTGAAGGIGRAIVTALEESGFRCAGFDLAQSPRSGAGSPSLAIAGDIGDDSAVESALARAAGELGRLDAVVHSAGIVRDAVVWKLAPEDWDEVQRVNLRGAYLLLRHAVPHLRERGGRVVLIGSINGSRGKFGQAAYAASKAGLIGLAKSAARETGRFDITVNVVEPGMVRTAMTGSLPPEVIEQAEGESLLGRLAEPADIAAAVAFLCGAGARHITGQVIRVDGGQYV